MMKYRWSDQFNYPIHISLFKILIKYSYAIARMPDYVIFKKKLKSNKVLLLTLQLIVISAYCAYTSTYILFN